MVLLITFVKSSDKNSSKHVDLRLEKGLTQEGLSKRSGVSLSSLRKFEQKGVISLESFLKLAMVLGNLERFVEASKPSGNNFTSIDDVLNKKENKRPERGWRK